VGLSYSVVYQVTDPVAYLSRAEQPTNLVSLLADEVLRRAVTAQPLSTLQAAVSQKNAPSDGWLAGTATQLQAAVEPLQLGITVKGLVLREVQLPAPVLQAMKDVDRQAQAQTKSLRDAQLGATERLIKAYKLAVNLRDESAAYAVALENRARSLSSGSTADDQQARAQAQQDLATQAGLWREQYPLLFSSQTALQGRIDPSSPNAATAVPDKTAPANSTDTWRDREIMRSRDRVARPGSGS
jgi:regulator of protease activity HflC (stomatin/prohibitin superfamily)